MATIVFGMALGFAALSHRDKPALTIRTAEPVDTVPAGYEPTFDIMSDPQPPHVVTAITQNFGTDKWEMQINDSHGNAMVSIDQSGHVTLQGKPDAAARAFWQAVEKTAPARCAP